MQLDEKLASQLRIGLREIALLVGIRSQIVEIKPPGPIVNQLVVATQDGRVRGQRQSVVRVQGSDIERVVPVERVARVSALRVGGIGKERHQTPPVDALPGMQHRVATRSFQNRREQIAHIHGHIGPCVGGDAPRPSHDERHAHAALEQHGLAPLERGIAGDRFPTGLRDPGHTAIVAEKNNEGVVGESAFLKSRNHSADRIVEAFDHGGVDRIVVAVPTPGPFLFKVGNVLRFGLQRGVRGEVGEKKQERSFGLFAGVRADEIHGLRGQFVGEVFVAEVLSAAADVGVSGRKRWGVGFGPVPPVPPVEKRRGAMVVEADGFKPLIVGLIPMRAMSAEMPLPDERGSVTGQRLREGGFIASFVTGPPRGKGKKCGSVQQRLRCGNRIAPNHRILGQRIPWRFDPVRGPGPRKVRRGRGEADPGGVTPGQQAGAGGRAQLRRPRLIKRKPLRGQAVNVRCLVELILGRNTGGPRGEGVDVHKAEIVGKDDNDVRRGAVRGVPSRDDTWKQQTTGADGEEQAQPLAQ